MALAGERSKGVLDVGAEAVKAADEVRAPGLEAAQIGAELHQVALGRAVVALAGGRDHRASWPITASQIDPTAPEARSFGRRWAMSTDLETDRR